MAKQKVLYVVHNHPNVRPGGAEAYALELYEAMRDRSSAYEPIFLAKGGPPISDTRRPHKGTMVSTVDGDPNQYFFYTDGFDSDWLNRTKRNKDIYIKHYHDFLQAFQPDVVHFQHTLFFGYDIIRQTRTTLPHAPILYTLHEFLPICHRSGQLVRIKNNELCMEASPSRCHECFPQISPEAFFLRKRFIQSHFSLVDLFLAPSHFLLERYVDWGIPRDKIRFEEYGRHTFQRLPEPDTDRPRNRFGFFGQFTSFKGVDVLLKAMKILGEEKAAAHAYPLVGKAAPPPPEAHLWLHGANLDMQAGSYQNEVNALLEATKDDVTMVGRYYRHELSRLMAHIDWVIIPSIWWENSPLVIQEAFQHGKPVICSNIGGMAEKVTDGVNGLHFRVGDPVDLAARIRQAAGTPGLWDTLRNGIAEPYRIEDAVETMSGIYDELIGQYAEAVS